jgi:hypothetical protein
MATAFQTSIDELVALIAALEQDPRGTFGDDIDRAERVLLSSAPLDRKREVLMEWIAKQSPCLFARVGARGRHGVSLWLCWLETADIDRGRNHVARLIQSQREKWKDEAAEGRSSAFLIMFNDHRLAHARPGADFIKVLQELAGCYLIEHAPIETDIIYTEAIPYRAGSEWYLFRAGVNFFYPAAHETANHDRRVPGGVLISVNSPGHLAHSQVGRGIEESFDEATRESLRLAQRSIGNGGIGTSRMSSCSWHNMMRDGGGKSVISRRDYSAVYHTDVLIPTAATLGTQADSAQCWDALRFDYISTARVSETHVNYGLFRGRPIHEASRYQNPWPPRCPLTLEDII